MNARERMNRELTREILGLRLPHGLILEAALFYTENADRKGIASCTYGHGNCAPVTGGPCLDETLGEIEELGFGWDDDWRRSAANLERRLRVRDEQVEAHNCDPIAWDDGPAIVRDIQEGRAYVDLIARVAGGIAGGLIAAGGSDRPAPNDVASLVIDYADALAFEIVQWTRDQVEG